MASKTGRCAYCCRENMSLKSRRLCGSCWQTPGIRARVPTRGKDYRKPEPAERAGPMRPTMALPGSDPKIEVLAARASARQPLFHAGDAGRIEARIMALGESNRSDPAAVCSVLPIIPAAFSWRNLRKRGLGSNRGRVFLLAETNLNNLFGFLLLSYRTMV